MTDLTKLLIAFIATVLPALAGFIVVFFQEKSNKLKLKNIEQLIANNGIYYIECPHCGKKIYLKNTKIMEEKENGRNS